MVLTLSITGGDDIESNNSVVLSTEQPNPVHDLDHLKDEGVLAQIVARFEHRQTQIRWEITKKKIKKSNENLICNFLRVIQDTLKNEKKIFNRPTSSGNERVAQY